MADTANHPPLSRQAVWVVACRIVGIAATLASNVLVARLLGPGEFGTYILITTVIALGGLIAMAGLNEAALRFISESLAHGNPWLARAYRNRALRVSGLAALVGCVLVTAVSALLLAGNPVTHSIALLLLVAVGMVVLGWQQLGAELVRAYGDLRAASLFSGGQAGGPVSSLIFLAGISAVAYGLGKFDVLLAVAVTVVSLCFTCPWVFWSLARLSHLPAKTPSDALKLSPAQRQELFTVATVLLANQLLAFATVQIDIWLAGSLLSPEALGLYGAAKRSLLIAVMPVQMAMLTIVATIPRLHAQRRTTKLEEVIRGAATAAAIPSLAAIAVLALFPSQILTLVLGAAYANAAPALLVMSIGQVVLILSGNPQHVLALTGRHRIVLIVNLLSALVLVIAGAVGAQLVGAVGLAAASAASLALQNILLWALARRELGIWTHVGLPRIGHAESGVEFASAATNRLKIASEFRPVAEPVQTSPA